MELTGRLRDALKDIESALGQRCEDAEHLARHIRDVVLPAMQRGRAASDALEELLPTDLWPLPTYAQMLFQR